MRLSQSHAFADQTRSVLGLFRCQGHLDRHRPHRYRSTVLKAGRSSCASTGALHRCASDRHRQVRTLRGRSGTLQTQVRREPDEQAWNPSAHRFGTPAQQGRGSTLRASRARHRASRSGCAWVPGRAATCCPLHGATSKNARFRRLLIVSGSFVPQTGEKKLFTPRRRPRRRSRSSRPGPGGWSAPAPASGPRGARRGRPRSGAWYRARRRSGRRRSGH